MSGMKVFMVFHSIGYGGADKMFAYIANTLSIKGFKVFIYTYESLDTPHYNLNESITLIREEKHYKRSHLNKIFQLINTRRHIRGIKPSIVVSFMSTSNFFSIISTRFTGIPALVSERGYPIAEKGLFSWIKKKSLIFAEAAVFQTEGAKRLYPRKLQINSKVIPNPVMSVDISLSSWNKRKKEISFVARFDINQKRQDIMVEAFREVSLKFPDYKLVFYGDGPDEKIIRKLVDSYHLTDKVIFKGKVDNVIGHLKQSKIFVISSDFEGIPNALVEAMSIGLPCVSTDCEPGGARMLINNNQNGILVPPNNSNSLAKAIMYLLENPSAAESMGIMAKQINDKYSEDKIQNEWVTFVNEVIKKTNKNCNL